MPEPVDVSRKHFFISIVCDSLFVTRPVCHTPPRTARLWGLKS